MKLDYWFVTNELLKEKKTRKINNKNQQQKILIFSKYEQINN